MGKVNRSPKQKAQVVPQNGDICHRKNIFKKRKKKPRKPLYYIKTYSVELLWPK